MTTPARTFGAEPLLRELAPQVLGAIVRRFRDFAAAEDAVQEDEERKFHVGKVQEKHVG